MALSMLGIKIEADVELLLRISQLLGVKEVASVVIMVFRIIRIYPDRLQVLLLSLGCFSFSSKAIGSLQRILKNDL